MLSADYSPSDELEDSVTILLRLADDGGLAEIAAPEAVAPMLSHMNRSAWSYLERNEEGVYKASVSPWPVPSVHALRLCDALDG